MKECKIHLEDRIVDGIVGEPRPELKEVDSSFPNKSLGLGNRGQGSRSPCPHYDYCLVKLMREDCNTYSNCQTYKFYNRYGRDWNEMFI